MKDKTKLTKMRILIISTFIPPGGGGTAQVAWETAKRLSKHKDVDVHILTTGRYGTEVKDGLTIHKVPYIKPLTIFYSTIAKVHINSLIRIYKFDIIHFHMPLPWGFVLRNHPAKKIITCHGGETGFDDINKTSNITKKIKFKIEKLLIKELIRRTPTFIAPSSYFSKEVSRFYGIKCIHIINGIDTKKFKPLKITKRKKSNIICREICRRKRYKRIIRSC